MTCWTQCWSNGCSRHVPTAILSRQTAGIRGKALILNLPGKPKAIRETIDEVQADKSNLSCSAAKFLQRSQLVHSAARSDCWSCMWHT